MNQPRHSIANHVRYKIASLLTEKVSLSFIAKSCQVSLTTVIRVLALFIPLEQDPFLFTPALEVEDAQNSSWAYEKIR
ncbi:hypothetical protein EfmJHP38_22720 [Enterococcus faecium]|nr:hypothetical protein EfmJHP38_22720 [Enterococcus faecium]